MDIDELTNKIFDNTPKIKNEIKLDLVDSLELDELFEFLLTLFTKGTRKLFVNSEGYVNLAMCTEKEYNLINQYFNSFGFEVELDRYNYPESELIDFEQISYKNIEIESDTKLEHLKLPLKCGEDIFVVYFNII